MLVSASCASEEAAEAAQESVEAAANLATEGETHIRNIRQLTSGGENAEAYWAFDGSRLIYQAKKPGAECDQIYIMDPGTGDSHLVSTGEGRTTCSYFYPVRGRDPLFVDPPPRRFVPPEPPTSRWATCGRSTTTYDVFVANIDGSNLRQLTTEDGYDAEATFSPTGDRIVFTSLRDGDLELYSMAPDGSGRAAAHRTASDTTGVRSIRPDASKIIWRAHYPEPGPEADDYVALLEEGLIRPGELDVYVMDADGSNQRQVTDVGGASFAPVLASGWGEDPLQL